MNRITKRNGNQDQWENGPLGNSGWNGLNRSEQARHRLQRKVRTDSESGSPRHPFHLLAQLGSRQSTVLVDQDQGADQEEETKMKVVERLEEVTQNDRRWQKAQNS